MEKQNKKTLNKKQSLKTVASVKKNDEEKKNNKPILIAGLVAMIIVVGLVATQLCCTDTKPVQVPRAAQSVKDDGVVVAIIGGKKIKMEELETVKNGIPQLKEMPMETVYNKLLELYVNNRVILDAAKKSGVQNRPEVKKMISDAQDQILFQAYLSEQLQSRTTQEKLKEIYAQEIKNYVPQDEIHARHILVATEKEAKDLIVQLKGGANFEKLANKYSLDKNPQVETGGDLGYFRKDMMIPEFGNAAFAIKVGQISEKPIKTPFGWHVVKVEDRRKAAPPTMAEMSEVIRARFTEETVPVILEEERTKAQVQVFDPLGVNVTADVVMDTPKKE